MEQSRAKLRKRGGKQNNATKKIKKFRSPTRTTPHSSAMARKIPPPREAPDPQECQEGHKGRQEGGQHDAEQGEGKFYVIFKNHFSKLEPERM